MVFLGIPAMHYRLITGEFQSASTRHGLSRWRHPNRTGVVGREFQSASTRHGLSRGENDKLGGSLLRFQSASTRHGLSREAQAGCPTCDISFNPLQRGMVFLGKIDLRRLCPLPGFNPLQRGMVFLGNHQIWNFQPESWAFQSASTRHGLSRLIVSLLGMFVVGLVSIRFNAAWSF